MEEFDESGEYTVDLPKILADKNHLSITRSIATQLMENPYMSVGQFLQSIPDRDLNTLCEILDDQFECDQRGESDIIDNFDDIVLLSLMLAKAEGLLVSGLDDVENYTNTLGVLITSEGMKRKGFVKMYYENISLGDDYADRIVAEKTDKLDDFLNGEEEDDDN